MKKKSEDQRDVSAFVEEFAKEEDEVNLREDKYIINLTMTFVFVA